ncbi:hypothetical protein JCM13267_11630 [Howardella ureilytica]
MIGAVGFDFSSVFTCNLTGIVAVGNIAVKIHSSGNPANTVSTRNGSNIIAIAYQYEGGLISFDAIDISCDSAG